MIIMLGTGLWIAYGQESAAIDASDTEEGTATTTQEQALDPNTQSESHKAQAQGVDWTAPDLAGTLVKIDAASLRATSKNPTISGSAKGFGSLNFGIISNDRDGSALFNLKAVPVVNERWSITFNPENFSNSPSNNVFTADGKVLDGSYNIQIFPGPSFVGSLMNATMTVHAE